MPATRPNVIIIAGPNGSGKSTAARRLLTGALGVREFVNADVIAQGLSAFEPEKVAISAGRIMLTRLKELAAMRANFAFETTLASRSFAPWVKGLIESGYQFRLIYIWAPSADFAIERVALRVSKGGHHVPADVIERRYRGGIRNFFGLYRPLAARWRCYTTFTGSPRVVAIGKGERYERIFDRQIWQDVTAAYERTQADPDGHG